MGATGVPPRRAQERVPTVQGRIRVVRSARLKPMRYLCDCHELGGCFNRFPLYQVSPLPSHTVHAAMPVRMSRNVSLTPELERYVAARVASGEYRSASEVVRAALRLLREREPGPPSLNAPAADAEPPPRRATAALG